MADPLMTTCSFHCYNPTMTAVSGVVFSFELVDPLSSTDAWSPDPIQKATSDGTGLVSISLARSMRWRMRGPDARAHDFTSGSTSTTALPNYVGTF